MTYLEKYKQDHPDAMYTCLGLPVDVDCPFQCGYEPEYTCPTGLDCVSCWNREIPEETEPEKTRYIRIAIDEDTYSDLVNGAETTHIVVKAEDIVESEPISQYADILNIAVHVNETGVYDPEEIISNVFKQISQIKDRMINISIM